MELFLRCVFYGYLFLLQVLFSIYAGIDAGGASEDGGEVSVVGISHPAGDFIDGQGGAAQQLFGVEHMYLPEIMFRTHADAGGEQPLAVEKADPGGGCDFFEAGRLRVVVMEVRNGASDPCIFDDSDGDGFFFL